MQAMLAKAAKLKLHNADALGHLFDTLVKSMACAGCEVWGPDCVAKVVAKADFGRCMAETKLHNMFSRRVLGLPKTAPCVPMLMEAGRQPFMVFWLRMAAQLWNRALGRDLHDLLNMALREGTDMLAELTDTRQLWADQFTHCLECLGVVWRGDGGALAQLDTKGMIKTAVEKWQAHEQADSAHQQDWGREQLAVRAAPDTFSRGFMTFTYSSWFAPPEGWVRKQSFMFYLTRPRDIKVVAQFRLGCHGLAVREGRWGVRTPRSQRTCPCCGHGVEDELHLWECPIYEDARSSFPSLCEPAESWTDRGFNERMNGTTKQHWIDLARFLNQCKKTRDVFLTSQRSP